MHSIPRPSSFGGPAGPAPLAALVQHCPHLRQLSLEGAFRWTTTLPTPAVAGSTAPSSAALSATPVTEAVAVRLPQASGRPGSDVTGGSNARIGRGVDCVPGALPRRFGDWRTEQLGDSDASLDDGCDEGGIGDMPWTSSRCPSLPLAVPCAGQSPCSSSTRAAAAPLPPSPLAALLCSLPVLSHLDLSHVASVRRADIAALLVSAPALRILVVPVRLRRAGHEGKSGGEAGEERTGSIRGVGGVGGEGDELERLARQRDVELEWR